jgi:hypothetical protein
MDSFPVIRIHDRIGGALVPLVVVMHALQSSCSEAAWRLLDLRASGDIDPLFPGGMLALEGSLPRDVDWLWLERLALLIEDVETIKFVSITSRHDSPVSVTCVDSSYWEITGPIAELQSVQKRFNAVDLR